MTEEGDDDEDEYDCGCMGPGPPSDSEEYVYPVSSEESKKSRVNRVINCGRSGRELLALKMQQEKLSRSAR